MLLPDANVLLHAMRSDSPDHERARTWLHEVHGGNEPIALCAPVLGGLLRTATHRRVYATPTPRSIVWSFVDAMRSSPLHRFVAAGPRHPDLLRKLAAGADATGGLVSDAAIAAIAVEHGSEVVSLDGDFARFEDLRWSRPWPTDG